MNTAVGVTVAIFLLGCVFAAGRLTSRVESLEVWRLQMERKLDDIHGALREIEKLIRGEVV